jgi:hypothetical protein
MLKTMATNLMMKNLKRKKMMTFIIIKENLFGQQKLKNLKE